MGLSQTQRQFTRCLTQLYVYMGKHGYEFTLGDAYRDPRAFGTWGEKKRYSHSKSVHKVRLAQDINLFVDGKYISDGCHPVYEELGEYWKSLDPDACWGGDFKDANHFSFKHRGMK